MNLQRIVLCIAAMITISCGSQKKIAYLQDEKDPSTSGKLPEFTLTISPHDILSIQVFTVNTEAFPGIASTVEKQVIDNRSPYEKGFIVDHEGNIELPLV